MCNLPVVTTDVGDVKEVLAGVEPPDIVHDLGAADLAAASVDGLAESAPEQWQDTLGLVHPGVGASPSACSRLRHQPRSGR